METKSLSGNQLPDALFHMEKTRIIFPRKLMPIGVLKEQATPQQKKTKCIY